MTDVLTSPAMLFWSWSESAEYLSVLHSDSTRWGRENGTTEQQCGNSNGIEKSHQYNLDQLEVLKLSWDRCQKQEWWLGVQWICSRCHNTL
eukprot:9402482-Ditylum_brightwellii.AAC.1